MLNRISLIENLYKEIENKIALLALLLGSYEPEIAESYYSEKKERSHLQRSLDLSNYKKYKRMHQPIIDEVQDYFDDYPDSIAMKELPNLN